MSEQDVIPAATSLPSIEAAPAAILHRAKECANALQQVISGKTKPVIINGEQYLEFEDWQTLARFYGYSVGTEWTRPIDIGMAHGWESRSRVLDANGIEVSAAEAMCLDDETRWKDREEFQRRSMAQTRASAKALRNVLAWVVVMAGFRPTPAEEMDGVGDRKTTPPANAASGPTTVRGKVEKVETKSGKTKAGKDYTMMTAYVGGQTYQTFSDTIQSKLVEAADSDAEVVLTFEVKTQGNFTNRNIVSVDVEVAAGAGQGELV